MAEKRMFSQKIVDSDHFLDMPLSAQALYFHLNMRADDDGFVNNPKKIQRMISATDNDLMLLLSKRFVIGFETGVIVIKHWRMHNTLRKDRYNPTQYQEEFALLKLKDNNSYTENTDGNQMETVWQPDGNQLVPQYSIDKNNKKICSTESNDSSKDEQLKADFDTIYAHYPKKVGKTKAFGRYKAWLTTGRRVNGKLKKLTNAKIWDAISVYKSRMEEDGTDLKFYKNFDTFLGDSILDYIDVEEGE